MGIQNSTLEYQGSKKPILLKNPSFSKCQILNNKEKLKCFFVSLQTSQDRNIFAIERAIKLSRMNFNEHILQLMDYQQGVSEQINCGMIESFNVVYEFCESTLEVETLKNWARNRRFKFINVFQHYFISEFFIWDLMKQISLAGSYLHSKNLSHGDFRGHNILITQLEDKKIYKLLDLTVTGKQNSQLQEFKKGIQKLCTLSPEEMAALKDESVTYNQQAADVFQAGMCLLQTATLSGCPQVY